MQMVLLPDALQIAQQGEGEQVETEHAPSVHIFQNDANKRPIRVMFLFY